MSRPFNGKIDIYQSEPNASRMRLPRRHVPEHSGIHTRIVRKHRHRPHVFVDPVNGLLTASNPTKSEIEACIPFSTIPQSEIQAYFPRPPSA
jgi:hypothetical protein